VLAISRSVGLLRQSGMLVTLGFGVLFDLCWMRVYCLRASLIFWRLRSRLEQRFLRSLTYLAAYPVIVLFQLQLNIKKKKSHSHLRWGSARWLRSWLATSALNCQVSSATTLAVCYSHTHVTVTLAVLTPICRRYRDSFHMDLVGLHVSKEHYSKQRFR
jgi:hypothetical protein